MHTQYIYSVCIIKHHIAHKRMYMYAPTLEAAELNVFLVRLWAWLQGLHLHHVELTVMNALTFALINQV